MIYRYWDQTELDRQMSARSTVPDIMPFVQAYARESALMRATLPCKLNVAYGPSEPERMDIFPARTADAPIFVFLHGGYWRLLDSADSSFMAKTFVEAGAVCVAVNYALAPSVSLDEIVRQCRASIAYVWHHAQEFGGDRARIHVCGSSAGGHLVGMMLAPDWQADYGLPPDCIQSACALSGLFDLEPVQLSNVNEWMKLDAEAAKRLSPLQHLPSAPVPLIVSYAPNETEEFKRQSEIYASACVAKSCAVEVVLEPGTNHYDLPLRLMDRASALTRVTLKIMGL